MKYTNILLGLLAVADAAGVKHAGRRRYARDAPPPPAPADTGSVAVFKACNAYTPKVVIVSLFEPEMAVWQKHYEFTNNITIPGLSPLFPHVFCTSDYEVCQVVTGESEINAAATMTAFVTSPQFDLSKSYFVVGGIAGISPYQGSLGSIAFSRFTVQVALEYEVDAREMPSNWTTGYWGYGTDSPGNYPGNFYGTEVFELNDNLRHRAYDLAKEVKLADATGANATRHKFDFAPANQGPSALLCDSVTSDVYYTGDYLSESFGNWTHMITNGTGVYCTTAQEDSAVMESLVRNARWGLVDFARVVLFRTASDFDRAPKGDDAVTFFNFGNTGGFGIAIDNIYIGANPIVTDILNNWDSVYKNGTVYAPTNYIGDIFGYIDPKSTPDFGPGNYRVFNYLA